MTNALSDFDRALSLAESRSADAADALLYRGLARMAGGKMAEAAGDLAKATDAATYGVASYVVWADIAARRAGLAPPNKSSPDLFKPDAWPGMFFRVAAGKESGAEAEAAIAAIYAGQPALAAARLCIAEAYLGEYALIAGDKDEARRRFGLAVINARRSTPRTWRRWRN